jgi:cell division protease FtsH
MLDEMCATMGGRAAEQVTLENFYLRFEESHKTSAMVTVYGLNDKIGNVTILPDKANIILLNPILKKLQNH